MHPIVSTARKGIDMTQTTHAVQSGGLALHAVTRGQPANPAMVLVHGYPDNHHVWDAVAEQLSATFYVIAYDVRGAGQSEQPKRVSDYRMPMLAADLKAVVDALIPNRSFHLAAHDWGSIQSWESVTTSALQGRIVSYSSISGPSLDHMGFWMRKHLFSLSPKRLWTAIKQLFSSWYIVFFQIPLLPALLWKGGVGKAWPWYLKIREEVNEPDINPTQVRDGVNGVRLYRANFIPKFAKPQRRYAHCPVQIIVPQRDYYVGTQLFSELTDWVDHLYRRDIDATHWLLLTHSATVAQWIGDFAQAMARGEETPELTQARISVPAPLPDTNETTMTPATSPSFFSAS